MTTIWKPSRTRSRCFSSPRTWSPLMCAPVATGIVGLIMCSARTMCGNKSLRFAASKIF
jgi:hypothetical protein